MKKIILFFILLWAGNCCAQGWQNCGDGVKGRPILYDWCYVSAMIADTANNILYVSGDFDTMNDSTILSPIARWSGTNWSSIPALDSIAFAFYNTTYDGNFINSMALYEGSLYLPASTTNNGNTNYYVVKYDGKKVQWLPYLDGQVNCFTVYHDTLYIGGDFYESDTTKLNHIAKWNGSNWLPVGNGFTGYAGPTVSSLEVCNNKLYAGGFFDGSGNTKHLFSIAQWNDTAWVALGRGIGDQNDTISEGYVWSICSYNNNLYVAGQFGYAGNNSVNNIAKWNGNAWTSIDQPFGAGIYALQVYNNKLYIGGGQNLGPFQKSERIASWDDTQWDTLGLGVNDIVNSLTIFQNNLYVGGQFDSAGNIQANSIARWSPDSTATGLKQLTITNSQLSISPNPYSQQTNLQFSQPITNNTQLTLYDLTGRKVESYFIASGVKSFIIKRNNLPAGMYFYKIIGGGMQELTGKIVAE